MGSDSPSGQVATSKPIQGSVFSITSSACLISSLLITQGYSFSNSEDSFSRLKNLPGCMISLNMLRFTLQWVHLYCPALLLPVSRYCPSQGADTVLSVNPHQKAHARCLRRKRSRSGDLCDKHHGVIACDNTQQ